MHRQIQKSAGDGYRAEVPLKLAWKFDKKVTGLTEEASGEIEGEEAEGARPMRPFLDNATVSVEGRADGVYMGPIPGDAKGAKDVYDYSPCLTVDEIKTTYRRITRIRKPEPVHLAQAKCYAYMLLRQNKLKRINVRMTYCNLYSGEIRYFYYNETEEGLRRWFVSLMEEYRRWAEYLFTWQVLRTDSIRRLDFPFPYREGQKQLAGGVYRTIERGKKLFLEAPTGAGKTITTLFPAIKAMGMGMTERIFYLTAKTITRTATEDTAELLRKNGLLLKSVTITAKAKICILDKPECNPDACPVARGHYDRINTALYDLLTHADDFSRETIELYAGLHKVCPFELSLDLTYFADLIIGDYNYVFDPHAYLRRFFGDGSQKGSHVFLVDEAHNLLERGRQMYSASVSLAETKQARREAEGLFQAVSAKLLLLERELKKLRERTGAFRVLEDAEGVSAAVIQAAVAFEQAFSELRIADQTGTWRQDPLHRAKKRAQDALLPFYFALNHFLYIPEKLDDHYVVYAEEGEDTLEEAGVPLLPMKEELPAAMSYALGKRGRKGPEDAFFVKLFCVDPSENLKECMERGRASVLFSATFLPIQYYKALLGGTEEDYEMYARSVFDPRKRGLFIVNDLTSRYSHRSRANYERIAMAIHSIIQNRHGNYMLFFPSFAFMRETAVCYALLYCTKEEAESVLHALLPGPKEKKDPWETDGERSRHIGEQYRKKKETGRQQKDDGQLDLFQVFGNGDDWEEAEEYALERFLPDAPLILWEEVFSDSGSEFAEIELPEPEKAGESADAALPAEYLPAEIPLPAPVPAGEAREPLPEAGALSTATAQSFAEEARRIAEEIPGAKPGPIDAQTTLLFQRTGMTEEEREAFLDAFRSADDEHSVLGFCVLGGIFSEGIDLREDALIGVVIVGTGIPSPTREREIVKDYFSDREKNGFDYAYRYPGMNKVLQAAGRVIRTANDVGIVALVDERFEMRSNQALFPAEWDNAESVSSLEVSRRVERFWDEWL